MFIFDLLFLGCFGFGFDFTFFDFSIFDLALTDAIQCLFKYISARDETEKKDIISFTFLSIYP